MSELADNAATPAARRKERRREMCIAFPKKYATDIRKLHCLSVDAEGHVSPIVFPAGASTPRSVLSTFFQRVGARRQHAGLKHTPKMMRGLPRKSVGTKRERGAFACGTD